MAAAQLSNELLLMIFEMAVEREVKVQQQKWYFPVESNPITALKVDYAQILKLLCVYRPVYGVRVVVAFLSEFVLKMQRLLELLYETVVIKGQDQMDQFLAIVNPEERKYRVSVDYASLVRSLIVFDGAMHQSDIDPLLSCLRHLKMFSIIVQADSKSLVCVNIDDLRLPFSKRLNFFHQTPSARQEPKNAVTQADYGSVFHSRQDFGEGNDLLTILEVGHCADDRLRLFEVIGASWHASGRRLLQNIVFPKQNGLTKLHLCGNWPLLEHCHDILDTNPQITHLRLAFGECISAVFPRHQSDRGYFELSRPFPDNVRFVSFENLYLNNDDLFELLPRHIQSIEITSCESDTSLTAEHIRNVLADSDTFPFPELKALLVSANSIWTESLNWSNEDEFDQFCEIAEELVEEWITTNIGEDGDDTAAFLKSYINSAGFVRPETCKRLSLATMSNIWPNISDDFVESAVLMLLETDCEQVRADVRAEDIRQIKFILDEHGIDGGDSSRWAFGGPLPSSDRTGQKAITDYFQVTPPGTQCACCRFPVSERVGGKKTESMSAIESAAAKVEMTQSKLNFHKTAKGGTLSA